MKNTYSYVDALNEVLTMALSDQCKDKLTALRDQVPASVGFPCPLDMNSIPHPTVMVQRISGKVGVKLISLPDLNNV